MLTLNSKLHNFLDLFQLFDDQNQLELVSIELVLLDDKLVVGHDHLASAKSPVVDRFRPSLDLESITIIVTSIIFILTIINIKTNLIKCF